MSDKESQALSGSMPVDNDEDQNVDKIREILFGGQMRDYQRRFDAMEAGMQANTERLRTDIHQRLDSLEGFVRRELELLGERLAGEKRERGEQRERSASELAETRRRLEETLTQLDEQTATEARNIRAAMQERAAELVKMIQNGHDDFNSMLTRQANSLEERKLNREDLAALFSEVSLRLNRELDIPSD